MKTRFLCENCAREVPSEANICPHCGTVFAAVKCPMCQFEGQISFFYDGCPQCHYHGEKLSRLLDSCAKPAAQSVKSIKNGKKNTKQKFRPSPKDRFYLVCSFLLAMVTIFLLIFLYCKH